MADVSKIQLPGGSEYNIKDEVARQMTLDVTYTAATYNLEFSFGSATTADDEEF